MIGQTLNWILGIDANILGMSASEFGQALARLEAGDAQLAEMMAKRDQLQLAVRLWATAFDVIAVLLTWLQSYRLLEKGQLVIVSLLLICMLAACLAVNPDWFAALTGLIPQVPKYPDWVASEYPKIAAIPEWVKVGVCLGAIGGGTYDYIGYIGCFREKKWGAIGRDIIPGETDGKCLPIDESETNIKRAKLWLWPVRIDVGVGFLCVLIFTVCFIVLGAVVLHTDHEVPSEFALLSKQARFLTDFHPALLYLYQIGIFMAFFGSIYGAYEIYLRATY